MRKKNLQNNSSIIYGYKTWDMKQKNRVVLEFFKWKVL